MCIIGRLSSLNPAFVMPTLRKVLIQILTELEYSGVGEEQGAECQTAGPPRGQCPQAGPAVPGPHSEGTNDPTEGTPLIRTLK